MEWNISLAIFLATKRVLCLEAIFSVSRLLASAGWRKTALASILFVGPRPFVFNRAGLTSVAAVEPVCWARNRWTRAASKPNSTALGFSYLKSCAATELGTPGASLTRLRATPGWEMYSSPKETCNKNCILGSCEQSSVCSFSRFLEQKKSLALGFRPVIVYLLDSCKCHRILTRISCYGLLMK